MPVSRVVVNTSTTRGALGLSTALSPSLTLGCVSRDKNVTYGQRSPAAPDGYKAHRLRDPTIEGVTPAPIEVLGSPRWRREETRRIRFTASTDRGLGSWPARAMPAIESYLGSGSRDPGPLSLRVGFCEKSSGYRLAESTG